jgi:porin
VAPAESTVTEAPVEPVPSQPWGSWAVATGDWGGVRTSLELAGIAVSGSYTYDASSVVRGGLRRGTIGRGLLDLGLSADLEKLAGLRGGSLFIGFHSHGGPNGSDYTGDAQAYSNVDAQKFAQIAEVFYEQQLFGERLRIKLGQVDANSEFAVAATAGEFINASAGFSPTIFGLPTYPDPTPSVNAFVHPVGWLSVSGGLYRGPLAPSGATPSSSGALFGVGEIAGAWTGSEHARDGRIGIGYWAHDGYAPVFAGGMQKAPSGWYATLEQRLSGQQATEEAGATGLTLFAKYGRADDRVSDFAQHFMLGLVEESPFGLGGHAAGIMVSAVDLSDQPAAGYARNETIIETFYRWPALGFLTFRPDLQYIVSPSGAINVPDAAVGTLRVEVAF